MPSPVDPADAAAGPQSVERADLDAARRRARPQPLTPGTTCPAANAELVIDPDGQVRTCEHAATTLGSAKEGSLTLWRGAYANTVRGELAAGHLPRPHCSGCARWWAADLHDQAPLVRDHAETTCEAEPQRPRTLVLRLPTTTAWSSKVQKDVLARLAECEHVVLAGDDPLAQPAFAVVTAALRALTKAPAVTIRLRRLVDAEALARATEGLPLREIEVLADDATAPIAGAAAFATARSARCTVRHLLTPTSWYELEELARAAAARGATVSWRVLDRGGSVPLDALDVGDLRFLKDAVGALWQRLGGDARPASVPAQAFDRLMAELRALLQRAATAEQAGALPGATPLSLPATTHPWCTDGDRATAWRAQLFGHGHLPCVQSWLVAMSAGPEGHERLRETTWLRVLAHRIACDHRPPELLDTLRALYQDGKARKRLVAGDSAFAQQVDLHPYGGPWAERLGLLDAEPRKRPFAIGKAKAPKPGTSADVTVLIPSYRHQDYIEETLRSVLAQRHANLKVLVVDDRSPDDTVARARAVEDPRVEVRVNDTNLGLGNSVLQALATIDTPFVALLNSDDLFHPDRVGRCRDALLAHPDVQLVTTGLCLVDQRGGELTPQNASLVLDGKLVHDWVHWFARVTPPADLPSDQLFAALLERNFLATSSNLVCRTDWLRAQATSLQSLKYCLDWQLFLEAAHAGALHHIHEPLVAYRLHATNTVWFREGRRWSYYLEVNRVAAHALRAFAKHAGARDDTRLARVLDALGSHLAGNRETDGFALFLNTVFDALQIDRLAERSPRVQDLVQRLNHLAEEVRDARDLAARSAEATPTRAPHRELLAELAEERARIERDNRRWLQSYADSLQSRLDECWAGRGALENDKRSLQQAAHGLHERIAELQHRGEGLQADVQRVTQEREAQVRRVQELDGELKRAHAARGVTELGERTQMARAEAAEGRARDQQRDLDGLRNDLAAARGALAAIQDLRRLLDQDLASVRGERDTLARQRDALTQERDALTQQREELARQKDGLARQHEDLTRAHATATADRDAVRARELALQDELTAAHDATEALSRQHDAVRAEAARLQAELAATQEARTSLAAQLAELQATHERHAQQWQRDAETLDGELRERVSQLDAQARVLAEQKDRTRTLEVAQEQLERRLHERVAEAGLQAKALAAETDRVRALEAEQERLERDLQQRVERADAQALELARERDRAAAAERQRDEGVRQLARARDEHEKLLRTREMRTGNFLWNKLPLGYMSRRGKKWYRRLVDAKDRALMMFRRKSKAEGTAIVTACWQWPIYSHTFVYQEMIGLTHMGLDVRLFHWDLGDTAQLHKAFGYLADNRTQLQPIWENHLRDKEHFEKTRPGRLRSFLERIAKATGRKVEDLENESLVLQGCTFARMAELAGATYLHSYFFYDQTFMAMQAAWLLDLPRGVSCYADHMLQDYPFKLVPLHVELCDVIVATSARIKRELSQMTGGKFDDKIIVKPNGVDGARFPPVARQDRKPGDPFEVVSISRIEPKKGLTHLVEAVAMLKKQGHKVKAHIVGSKDPHSKGSLEYAAEFEQRIADLGVQDEVILHGMKRQEELPPILQRCRAFVAPYVEMGSGDKDGIPTAMLEGLASGLPVVTTDSGSILEVVTTEVEGIVVPQRDSKAFAKALQRLIEDPALERKMAKAARTRFDREFDIRVTEVRLHERVAKLVARGKKSKPKPAPQPAR